MMVSRSWGSLAAVLLASCLATASKNSHLPASFPRCSLSLTGSQLNDCLRDAVQIVIPQLVKGVPSLGVLSIDPLDILEADIGATGGPVALALNFKKLKIGGLASTKVLSMSFDPKAMHISMRAKVTEPLRLDGNYRINGKVLVLPIQGEGRCSLKLDDVTADIVIDMHDMVRGSQKHLAVDSFKLSFDTSRLHMNFENLFNGNKELGDNMNRFLNENWPEILKELKPSIDETFGAAFQAIANRIFQRVAYDNIFLH